MPRFTGSKKKEKEETVEYHDPTSEKWWYSWLASEEQNVASLQIGNKMLKISNHHIQVEEWVTRQRILRRNRGVLK